MRYWIRRDTLSYELSEDDMSFMGYVEVTKRPDVYPEVYSWSFSESRWVADREALRVAIAQRRYDVETAGVYVGDFRIDTTDRGKLMLVMAASRAESLPEGTLVSWKISNDSYTSFTPAQIIALKNEVCDYIGQCFEHERVLADRIIRQDFDVAEIATGWPSNLITLAGITA